MNDDLYQQAIINIAREAEGAGRLDHADASVTVDNPLCGDRITLDVAMDEDRVAHVGHKVRGCLLCQAAAAVIGRHAVGLGAEALRATVADMRKILGGGAPSDHAWLELELFRPVASYKSRHECVLLPFDALNEALDQIAARKREH